MNNFSDAVKNSLKTNKITVKELSKSTKISQSYIYDLINGKKRWNETVVKKISKQLGIAVEFKLIS